MAGIVAIPTSGMGGGTSINLFDYYIANQSSLDYKEEYRSLDANMSVVNKITINGKGFLMSCEYSMYSGTSKVEFVVDGEKIKTLTASHKSKSENVKIKNWAGGNCCWSDNFEKINDFSSSCYLLNDTLSISVPSSSSSSGIVLYEPVKFNNTLDIIVTYTNTTFTSTFYFNYYLFK